VFATGGQFSERLRKASAEPQVLVLEKPYRTEQMVQAMKQASEWIRAT